MQAQARPLLSRACQSLSGRAGQAARLWLAGIAVTVTTAAAAQAEIVSARYLDPTDRYGHRVLGAEGEYTTLEVTLANGKKRALKWRDTLVFEDIAPRLADLDGDGAPEVITVQSHEKLGAQVAVYRLTADILHKSATNDFIGRRNRWLAVIGAADLDGDGHMEIAYIDRPHLAKTLRIFRFKTTDAQTASLTSVASLAGLTNHRIGEDFISSGIRDCGQGPEMITADGNWSQLHATVLKSGKLTTRPLGPYSPEALKAALACR